MIKIEITTIEDLVAFVQIVRGEMPDEIQIKKIINSLNKSSSNLKVAVARNS